MNDEENRRILTPEMCRAARAFLDWTQADLAERAAVARGTVRDFEGSAHAVHRSTPGLLRAALEIGGAPLVTLDDGRIALIPGADFRE